MERCDICQRKKRLHEVSKVLRDYFLYADDNESRLNAQRICSNCRKEAYLDRDIFLHTMPVDLQIKYVEHMQTIKSNYQTKVQTPIAEKRKKDQARVAPDVYKYEHGNNTTTVSIVFSSSDHPDISIAKKPRNDYSYDPVYRELIAEQVCRCNVSFEMSKRLNKTLRVHKIPLLSFSTSHAIRCCVELDICLNYSLALKMKRSSDLGFGCDETPIKNPGRSFLENHAFGVENGARWVEFVRLVELCAAGSKTAESITNHLVETHEYLQDLCNDTPPLHNFYLLSYDNCNTNTGEFNGVGVLWDAERSKDYNNYIKKNKLDPESYKYKPTIARGCKDHEAAMFGKRFSSKLADYLKKIGRNDMFKEGIANFCYYYYYNDYYCYHYFDFFS